MISEVDIRDMKPSDRVEAVNHVGWTVQLLTLAGWVDGWQIYYNKSEAVEALEAKQKMFPVAEYRVYEVVSNKQLAALFKPKGA